MKKREKLFIVAMGLALYSVERILYPQKYAAKKKNRKTKRYSSIKKPQVRVHRVKPVQSRAASKPTKLIHQIDKTKMSRREQYEKYGYWTAYIGGGYATSSKDPDDWEHPYTK